MDVETSDAIASASRSGLAIRLLGPLTVIRDGVRLELPASRKSCALLAYLAHVSKPVHRDQLCELLWDVANDPRSELRWCLSKLRRLTDENLRLVTAGETVALETNGSSIDACHVSTTMKAGCTRLDRDQLEALAACFAGDFLEGLEVDRRLPFAAWLTGMRRSYRMMHGEVLKHLAEVSRTTPEDSLPYIERWLELAPCDPRPHVMLFQVLAGAGRLRDGEEHLATTARYFEAESLDWAPLRAAWQSAKAAGRKNPSGTTVTCVHSAGVRSSFFPVETGPVRRASLAVMPFREFSDAAMEEGGLADGLVHDIIARLSKLKNLFVIARGSVFALGQRGVGTQEAARILGADYVASGRVDCRGQQLKVSVEVAESGTGQVIWAETYHRTLDDTFLVLELIGNDIVASIESEVENTETARAFLKPADSLDAWEAYHRGLWHMYQFNASGNEQAQHFFGRALVLDPTFSRAHAGMSFTHFQNAFLLRTSEREREIALAYDSAGASLAADDRSPAAHWAMGRALWLRRDIEGSLSELETAVGLSPNFSLGHYTLGFVRCQAGEPQLAIAATDLSRSLSPFDPLLFGMLAVRALAHLHLGQFDAAAEWAVKAAARPNAHAHIKAIAGYCLSAAGRSQEAQSYFIRLQASNPGYGLEDFLGAFRFSEDAVETFRKLGDPVPG
ncbi:hypothetical protein ACFOW6_00960 [Fodinicurvata halophila]|uniref:Bacterial transcriptional activator domain-containing protein n=1 Tax=Fodinicurvata halophila TaxID=1419723 RepID=A0ABV8UFS6_9PROT